MRIIFYILVCSTVINAQQFFIQGKVFDASTSQRLSFTNIRVAGTTYGTAANKNGEYELKAKPGNYTLVASFIGYKSDTISVNLNKNISSLNFYLKRTDISLPEITITPGEDPAIRIIKRAIRRKNERNKKLSSYEYEAYTKAVLKTEDDLNMKGRKFNLSIGGNDTTQLKISAIIENQSKGYFKKPDNYKEVILARKQSANLPPTLNIFTGGRLIENLYENKVSITNNSLPGPLADNALNYYKYYLKNISAINDQSVYEIFMTPSVKSNPGFEGNIYIIDGSYDLLKVDLTLNNAANVGGIFDTIRVVQQFSVFSDSISMPIDYHMLVGIDYLGLVKFGFEVNSILYNFKINPPIDGSFFNKAVVTVLPDADKKDPSYWKETQTIPNTTAEQKAYSRIDSLSNITESFGERFSFLSSSVNFSNHFSTSGPLSMYHFNRVEGNALDFGLNFYDLDERRLYSDLDFSYGFSDKKFKSEINARYLLGDYRTWRINFDAYNKMKVLFVGSDVYKKLTSTLLALLVKNDFRDYYYSRGFNFNVRGEVFPILNLSAGFMNTTDNNAFKNTSVSVFKTKREYRDNPPIYETKINAFTTGFTLDFRDYIEDGLFRRRTSFGKSYIIFSGDLTYSNRDILNSGESFTKYELSAFGRLNSVKSTSLRYRIYGMYNNGYLPLQLMYALPADIDLVSHSFTFRTLDYNEITGDRVVTLNLDYNFGTEVFRLLNIPGFKDWDITLNAFLNAAYSDISSESRSILPRQVYTFNSTFYEIGFGLAHALIPIKIEFAWKLNHRGENNFKVGFNINML